ncbi:MAG: hypothetical protein N2Z62_14040 [Rhodobacteraceae bacterium]|nr:hypothetical protein [Paracoccaceae bacterium]
MIKGLFDRLESRAAATARRLGILAGALLLSAIGLGLLASAGWMALAASHGAVFASVAMGLGFLGVGLLTLGILAATARPAAEPPRPDPAVAAGLIAEAFVAGITAGRAARR